MGYHLKKIQKGKLGEFSKIKEEFQELEDAYLQDNPIMELIEMSDLVGAIEKYIENYNLTINDLIEMKNATQRAFEDGTRK